MAHPLTTFSPRKRDLKALTKVAEPLICEELNNGALDLSPSAGYLDQEENETE
jgi:hypothetical protein